LNTVLGKGAYKVVYKAIDREEGYEVAWNCFQVSIMVYMTLSRMKLRIDCSSVSHLSILSIIIKQTTKAQFNALSQEISILKEVRHPNIIAFHDWWYSKDNEFIFVAELMTSGTLREYVTWMFLCRKSLCIAE